MQLRHVRPSDCDCVLAVIDEWWGGPATTLHLPHDFFSHLAPTSFVLEASDGKLVGFLPPRRSAARRGASRQAVCTQPTLADDWAPRPSRGFKRKRQLVPQTGQSTAP
jgi:hypothetical protein